MPERSHTAVEFFRIFSWRRHANDAFLGSTFACSQVAPEKKADVAPWQDETSILLGRIPSPLKGLLPRPMRFVLLDELPSLRGKNAVRKPILRRLTVFGGSPRQFCLVPGRAGL